MPVQGQGRRADTARGSRPGGSAGRTGNQMGRMTACMPARAGDEPRECQLRPGPRRAAPPARSCARPGRPRPPSASGTAQPLSRVLPGHVRSDGGPRPPGREWDVYPALTVGRSCRPAIRRAPASPAPALCDSRRKTGITPVRRSPASAWSAGCRSRARQVTWVITQQWCWHVLQALLALHSLGWRHDGDADDSRA